MTELNDTDASEKTEADWVRETVETTFPFDSVLANLVAYVNVLGGVEIGITLHVKGSVVSGMLISADQHFRTLVETLQNPDTSADPDTHRIAYNFGEFFRPTLEAQEESLADFKSNNILPPQPRHIHLRYAQIYMSAEPTLTCHLWRGRLAEIDGWSIGNFGTIPAPDHMA